MRYVFISEFGDSLPLAQHIDREGHNTSFYTCSETESVTDKMVTQLGPDIIIFDMPGFGKLGEKLLKYGFPVLGASRFSDQLYCNEDYNSKVLKLCGVSVNTLDTTLRLEVEGWFNGHMFLSILYTMDSVVALGDNQDSLFKKGLGQLVPALQKTKYVGPVSITATFEHKNLFFSNLQAKFTKTSMLVLKEGCKRKISDTLNGLANNINRIYMLKPGFYMSVDLILNPDVILSRRGYSSHEVFGLNSFNLKHLWLYSVVHNQNGSYAYCGPGGRIAVVTARGDTIREARRRIYRTIHNLSISSILYESKLGSKTMNIYAKAREWGYIQ